MDKNTITKPEKEPTIKAEIPPDVKSSNAQSPPVDPTRYGDWELNGKCVDF